MDTVSNYGNEDPWITMPLSGCTFACCNGGRFSCVAFCTVCFGAQIDVVVECGFLVFMFV